MTVVAVIIRYRNLFGRNASAVECLHPSVEDGTSVTSSYNFKGFHEQS
ncbi:MAG: hypothetical protein ABSG16_20555 [Candidatus Acidiferrum sp.]